ncbi:MAG: hypothetical protein Q8L81_10690 [Bacteroidota bacterium]|nr:hypothetical protein [Bacteroidota bacterium]
MKNITLTREDLYKLVWSTPMTTLVKNYLISDSGLRKICKKMDIPIPKAGHWQKIQYRKEVEIESLSLGHSGDQEITLFLNDGDKENNAQSPLSKLQKEIEADFSLSLNVSGKLNNPDKLVIISKETLMKQRPSGFGNGKGLVHTYRDQLSIQVSPDNVNRSLCFMDTFIKLIRLRGHKVIQENRTFILIDDIRLEISLREKMKRVMLDTKYSWKTAEDSPSGKLCFRIKERSYRIYEWKDGKLPIEKQLSKILAFIEIKVKEIIAEDLRIKEYWDKERERNRIKQNIQKQKEEELIKFKGLLQNAKRWQEAEFIRSYISAVEKKPIQDEFSELSQGWIQWARKKADWYDPNIEAEDSMMQGVDRSSLTLKPPY